MMSSLAMHQYPAGAGRVTSSGTVDHDHAVPHGHTNSDISGSTRLGGYGL